MDSRRLPADALVRPGEEATWLSKAIPVAPAPRSQLTRCHRRLLRTARSRTCRSSLLLRWTSCLGGGSRATGGGQSATPRKRRFFSLRLGPTLHSSDDRTAQTWKAERGDSHSLGDRRNPIARDGPRLPRYLLNQTARLGNTRCPSVAHSARKRRVRPHRQSGDGQESRHIAPEGHIGLRFPK